MASEERVLTSNLFRSHLRIAASIGCGHRWRLARRHL